MSQAGEAGGSDIDRLRRIEAVTDRSLVHLEAEELLDELLDRTCELLAVDTAVVLLLDEDTDELVPTVARGLDPEVHEGLRISRGQGFSGRILASRAPAVLDEVDETNVANPMLRKRGVRSLLGVPLMVSGRPLGVLHVGTFSPRRFDDDDVHLVEMVADRMALALMTRLAQVERTAATALQRSLLPARLPTIEGLELAARYRPGGEGGVGGDWYDVFTLPEDRVGVVIGDVVGRGLPAAVVMGRLRSALRAYALEAADPADALERLDRKALHFEAGKMSTVIYGVISLATSSITISVAGHLLPVVDRSGVGAEPLEAIVDPPIGVTADAERHQTTVDLAPGCGLLLFTDGLVERRGVPLDDELERLRAGLAGLPAQTAEGMCATALALFAEGDGADDVALLAVRYDVRRPG